MVEVAGPGAFGVAPGIEVGVFVEEVAVTVGFGLVALSPVARGVVVVGVAVVVGVVVVVGVIVAAVVVVGVVVVGPAASEAAPGVAWRDVVTVVGGSLSVGLLPPWSACAATSGQRSPAGKTDACHRRRD